MGLIITTNGTGYTTLASVKTKCGISSTTDITDDDLKSLIVWASRMLSRDITQRAFAEKPEGSIDGTNRVFVVKHRYLADRDLNLAVGTSDVNVYAVKEETDGSKTRTSRTLSAVDSFTGKLTLSAAPTTAEADYLEVDYEWYERPVYSDMLEAATNALVAHFVQLRNRTPGKVTLDQLRGASSGLEMLKGSVAWSTGSRWAAEYAEWVQRIRTGNLR